MRTRLKEVVVAAIREAAEQVFAEEGLDAPMETIAARAGVAVGTLYNHFTDRHALMASIADAHRAEVLRRLELVTAKRALPFRERLVASLQQVVDATSPATLRLRLVLFQHTNQRARVAGLTRIPPLKFKLTELIEQTLVDGRKAKLLRADPQRLQATMLVAMLMGVLHRCAEDEAPVVSGVAERVVETFLDGAALRPR